MKAREENRYTKLKEVLLPGCKGEASKKKRNKRREGPE
jgi:hypothetical protein